MYSARRKGEELHNLGLNFHTTKKKVWYIFRKKKTKTAFWIASHCPTEIKRENYVKALQKYIDVDVYGDCGNLTCVGTCIDDNSLEVAGYFNLGYFNSGHFNPSLFNHRHFYHDLLIHELFNHKHSS